MVMAAGVGGATLPADAEEHGAGLLSIQFCNPDSCQVTVHRHWSRTAVAWPCRNTPHHHHLAPQPLGITELTTLLSNMTPRDPITAVCSFLAI